MSTGDVTPHHCLLEILQKLVVVLHGRRAMPWLDGVEFELWRYVMGDAPFPGDSYAPLLRAAKELYYETAGWYVSGETGPVFVGWRTWDSIRRQGRRVGVVHLPELRTDPPGDPV